MLVVVTGGIGCGKSAYAEKWALSLGREAIRLECPTLPTEIGDNGFDPPATIPGFVWRRYPADATLASKLNEINLESNVFRAESRVVLIDSLSGWLRAHVYNAVKANHLWHEARPALDQDWQRFMEALFTFQGKVIVITEETTATLAFDPWESWYIGRLAETNRKLAEVSHAMYRMTAGIAVEIKGRRTKRDGLKTGMEER